MHMKLGVSTQEKAEFQLCMGMAVIGFCINQKNMVRKPVLTIKQFVVHDNTSPIIFILM